jgi:N-acetylglucosamine malate deacetylase 1
VLTHAPDDYHSDHRALSAATSHAVNFAAPLIWFDTLGGTGFTPTHWIDVTAHFDAKLAAIRLHASQEPERFAAMPPRPRPPSAPASASAALTPAPKPSASSHASPSPTSAPSSPLPPPVRPVVLRSEGRQS